MSKKLSSWGLRAVAALGLFTCAASSTNAQVLYGSIVGTVEDPTGSVVPGAGITITNAATGASREVKADESGRYTASNLLPGDYTMVVTATGFRTLTRTG